MDSETLQEIIIKSCGDMYEQMEALQKGANPQDMKLVSMILNDVRHVNRKGNYLKITLTNKIVGDLEQMGLHIEGVGNFFEEVVFDNYDEGSLTISVYPTEDVMNIINEHKDEELKVIFDLKWLIQLTQGYFEDYGTFIGYPSNTLHFEQGDYKFPEGLEPTEEQRAAVDTILNSPVSYIWGAPGTGKTQFVMATAILAHIRKGGRVAVIAPTNNAVEQVLRGVMKVIELEDPNHELINPAEDILRMGAATSEFLRDYKEICENRAVMAHIKSLMESNETMNNVIYERGIDKIKSLFSKIDTIYGTEYDSADYSKRKVLDKQLQDCWSKIKNHVSKKPEFIGLVGGIDITNLRSNYMDIRNRLFERRREELDIHQYKDLSDEELIEKIKQNEKEIEELEPFTTSYRVSKVKIMAMTPFILMGRSKILMKQGGILGVNQIFVDEVGYSNLIQTMPVFTLGKPVAMLGDHMQLPPVCELDFEDIKAWCTEEDPWRKDGYMKYSFMWDQPLIYIENYLSGTIEDARDDYVFKREPHFNVVKKSNLTQSHRFADNLAKILDDSVYHIGIRGHGFDPLKVICVDVVGLTGDVRENREEAEKIRDYIAEHRESLGSYVILTPYTNQRKMVRRICRDDAENVLTIHGSQGREWDTVILSVCDNRNSNREVPLRFTSCIPPNDGMRVINTAVSRAKKQLVIFCDYEFWKERAEDEDLLGLIVDDMMTLVL